MVESHEGRIERTRERRGLLLALSMESHEGRIERGRGRRREDPQEVNLMKGELKGSASRCRRCRSLLRNLMKGELKVRRDHHARWSVRPWNLMKGELKVALLNNSSLTFSGNLMKGELKAGPGSVTVAHGLSGRIS